MVAAQWNWSKKWQHACHYNPHNFVWNYFIYLISDSFFQYPDAFKNWGGGVYLKKIHNKITKSKCYQLLFLRYRQWDMQPNPSPNPISSVRLFCNLKFFIPDQSLL